MRRNILKIMGAFPVMAFSAGLHTSNPMGDGKKSAVQKSGCCELVVTESYITGAGYHLDGVTGPRLEYITDQVVNDSGWNFAFPLNVFTPSDKPDGHEITIVNKSSNAVQFTAFDNVNAFQMSPNGSITLVSILDFWHEKSRNSLVF